MAEAPPVYGRGFKNHTIRLSESEFRPMVASSAGNSTALLLAIPTKQEISDLASLLPTSATNPVGYSRGPRTMLSIGAGVIRIRQTDQAKTDAARVERINSRTRSITSLVREENAWLNAPMALVETPEDFKAAFLAEHPELAGMTGVKRDRITCWTRASKNRMQLVLAQLDYSPLFETGAPPAMVTLTMPGAMWERCAPNPAAFKKLVEGFKMRYLRAWGSMPVGVWKMEFQLRGAPHLHILMTPPRGVSADGLKLPFRAWLGMAWAAVVDVPDPVERAKHERAGTGIDYPEGQRYNDPKRIAQYFSKHGAYLAKDYQNEMPQLWLDALDAGEGGARFWGYWGLEKAVAQVELRATPPVVCEFAGMTKDALSAQSWEIEEVASWATDKSVLRAWFRDNQGSKQAADAVIVQRHLRKLARSMAANRSRTITVGNKRYRPIVLETFETIDRTTGEIREHVGRTSMRTRKQQRWVTVPAGSAFKDRMVRDSDTGEWENVLQHVEWDEYRELKTKTVVGYYQGGSGYLVVNDGRVTGTDIIRLLSSRSLFSLVA